MGKYRRYNPLNGEITEHRFDGFKEYRKRHAQMLRPYIPGEDMSGIRVSGVDTLELGGMVAVNSDNEQDKWYVAKEYFEAEYELIGT